MERPPILGGFFIYNHFFLYLSRMETHGMEEFMNLKRASYDSLMEDKRLLKELRANTKAEKEDFEKELTDKTTKQLEQLELAYSEFFLFFLKGYKNFELEIEEGEDKETTIDFNELFNVYNRVEKGGLLTVFLAGQGEGKDPLLKIMSNAKK